MFLDFNTLRFLLSIALGWFRDFNWSGDFVSELSIKSLRVSLHLLQIVQISDFPSASPTTYLNIHFQKIMTILFWCGREILAYIFYRRVYVPVKLTLSIDNIVYWLSVYQSLFFKLMAQTKLRFCQVVYLNYLNTTPDLFYHFSMKKKEKIWCMRFPPKIVTVCFWEKKGFDCKNNYGCNKLANI